MNNDCYVVTGANSGLGLALVANLQKSGKKVIGIDVNINRIERLIEVVKCDLRMEDFCTHFPGEKMFKYNNVILINNAGVCQMGDFFSTDFQLTESMLTVNLIAPLRLAHFLNQFGNLRYVVNISSSSELLGLPKFAAYGASKRALHYWSDTMVRESQKTKFLTIIPGAMKTNLQANTIFTSKAFTMDPDIVAKTVLNLVSRESQGHRYIGVRCRISLFISKIPFSRVRKTIVEKLFHD
jgi:short-subunit dehydrogenase